VVIGDTVADVNGARANGARAIGVATGRTTAD
jgi:phosphoglycolate phosphatase-like HAD superfamily hydrolase